VKRGEEDRLAVHEIGHSLVGLVLCGRAGSVILSRTGGGRCQPAWAPELKDLGDEPTYLACASLDAGGIVAEQMIYGRYDVESAWGTRDQPGDLKSLDAAISELNRMGRPRLTRQGVEMIDRYLLQTYEDALWAGIRKLAYRHGQTTPGYELTDTFIAACPELAALHDSPMLAGRDWQAAWDALALDATKSWLREPGTQPPVRSPERLEQALRQSYR
jgi:hypothetical protein